MFRLKLFAVSALLDPHHPDVRHHEGTLRELYNFTTKLPTEECPPLNAISLPAFRRNLHVPCQFGSLASHEVAMNRVPSTYERVFDVPDVESQMEWALVGSKGTVSPLHIDSEGLGTVVVILDGSKYWIVATRYGEQQIICSVDSLGPHWTPYVFNDGDGVEGFRFEAVHLQKGDML